MLIQSLKQHFPARAPEWLVTGAMISWGLYVILHPAIFTRPETAALFSGMAQMVAWTDMDPAGVWGSVSVVVGLLRAAALFINGAYARTPVVRLLASFISAFIWTQVVIGLVRAETPNTGMIVYGWYVIADLISAYRAGLDAVLAENSRVTGGVSGAIARGR